MIIKSPTHPPLGKNGKKKEDLIGLSKKENKNEKRV